MKTLREQIRDGEIGRLYLFQGNEPFLIRLNLDRLKRAVMTEEDEMMNLDHFRGNIDIEALKISLETLPFLSERRLVIVEDSKLFAGKSSNSDEEGQEKVSSDVEGLIQLLGDLPDTTTAVFVEQDIDKRTRIYKTVQKAGQVMVYDHPGEKEMTTWITQEFRKNKVRIDPGTIQYLLSLTGPDMANILSEIGKLSSYAKEKGTVSREDIDLLVSPSIEIKIFRLTDHLGNGRREAAYLDFQELLKQNEKPERIFYMIARQYHLLYRTSLYDREGSDVVASELGLHPYVAREYQNQARRYGTRNLFQIVRKLYDLDLAIKTGEITVQEALDLVLLKYAQPKKTR